MMKMNKFEYNLYIFKVVPVEVFYLVINMGQHLCQKDLRIEFIILLAWYKLCEIWDRHGIGSSSPLPLLID